MTPGRACALIGTWRIVEAELWDRDYLDLVEPAYMTLEGHGRGRFAFGRVQGSIDCEYSRRIAFFTWQGFDEMDEVWGDGSAELEDDGFLDIELRFHDGGQATPKAQKWWVIRRPAGAHHAPPIVPAEYSRQAPTDESA